METTCLRNGGKRDLSMYWQSQREVHNNVLHFHVFSSGQKQPLQRKVPGMLR